MNTERRIRNSNGETFIPMNIEGSTWNESFITPAKVATVGCILAAAFFIVVYCKDNAKPLLSWIIYFGIWLIASIQALRYIVFEEKFYFKVYQAQKAHEIDTPRICWNISSKRVTPDGMILTFSDGKIGVVFTDERDTITGRRRDAEEEHFDALSDFYKEVVDSGYRFVKMNIMQESGKDPRMEEVDKLITSSDNSSIQQLMKLEIGYLKKIARVSLYENEYYLFYTENLQKYDSIIDDATRFMGKLLDGAYINFRMLTYNECVDLFKEDNGVKYFNSTEASLGIYSDLSDAMQEPFQISGITWYNGDEQILNRAELNKLNRIIGSVEREEKRMDEISIYKELFRKDKKDKGISFDSLGQIGNNAKKTSNKPTTPHRSASADDEFIDF